MPTQQDTPAPPRTTAPGSAPRIPQPPASWRRAIRLVDADGLPSPFALTAMPTGLVIQAIVPGETLRFRIALDSAVRVRPHLHRPALVTGVAAAAEAARALDACLRLQANGDVLCAVAGVAAATEAPGVAGDDPIRANRLAVLAGDLRTWRALPEGARLPAIEHLARCGADLAVPPTPEESGAAVEAIGAAVDAMMSGSRKPVAQPSDPCLSGVAAAVDRARAKGVRSTLAVTVGTHPEAAPRIAGVPAPLTPEDLGAEASAGSAGARDLVVAYCAAPQAASLTRLLKVLSVGGGDAMLVAYDAEEVLVGRVSALSRRLGF